MHILQNKCKQNAQTIALDDANDRFRLCKRYVCMLLTIRLYAINHSFVTHKSMVSRYKTIVPYLTFVTLTKKRRSYSVSKKSK